MELCLIQAKDLIQLLQAGATRSLKEVQRQPADAKCQAHAMLVRQLKMLMITKQAVTKALCEIPVDTEQAGDEQGAVAQDLTEQLHCVLKWTASMPGCEQLKEEVSARATAVQCQQAAAIRRLRSSAACTPADADLLAAALEELHQHQQSVHFQAVLAQEAAKAAKSTRWSLDNFAYGWTPLDSWITLCEHPLVAEHITTSRRHSLQLQVWGSSIGWLLLYGALTCHLQTYGYEILKPLAKFSAELVRRHEVTAVTVHQQDMLEADLSQAGIVVLASQCWDISLLNAAADKLQQEMHPQGLMIAYNSCPALGSPAGTVAVATSWNEKQMMHLYKTKQYPNNVA